MFVHKCQFLSTQIDVVTVRNKTKMTESNVIPERLYLHKDASGDVSVPCNDLAQHQIEGVRFLFKQYRKIKPGVIINYPPGCGKSVLIGIFVNAIHTDLEKPVLILYDKEQEKQHWLEVFSKWTDIDEDKIAVDSPNVFIRKLIHLKNITEVDSLCGRDWSVLVLKKDEVDKKFLRFPLNADYKIWITSTDMKEDRELLRSVYMWMYHTPDAQIQKYFGQKSISKEALINNILLKSLLEDVLLTKRNLKPFRRSKRTHVPEIEINSRVSRKNKDATGTKIKRSRKYQENPTTSTILDKSVTPLTSNNDDTTSNSSSVHSNYSNNVANSSIMTITVEEDEESKMDVESFIRDNEPLERGDSNLSMTVRNLDNASPKEEVMGATVSLNFSYAADEFVQIDNNTSAEGSQSSLDFAVELINEDLNQDIVEPGNSKLIQDSTESDQPLYTPIIQNVFSIKPDEELNIKAELDNDDISVVQIDLDDSKEGNADQGSKVEVTTSVMKQTDSSFDSKMKEIEKRALQKFKGSFLDNLF